MQAYKVKILPESPGNPVNIPPIIMSAEDFVLNYLNTSCTSTLQTTVFKMLEPHFNSLVNSTWAVETSRRHFIP